MSCIEARYLPICWYLACRLLIAITLNNDHQQLEERNTSHCYLVWSGAVRCCLPLMHEAGPPPVLATRPWPWTRHPSATTFPTTMSSPTLAWIQALQSYLSQCPNHLRPRQHEIALTPLPFPRRISRNGRENPRARQNGEAVQQINAP